MARKVDPETLSGFIEEARDCLRHILPAVETFLTDPARTDGMEEAHRRIHVMRGGAGLVGLSALADLSQCLEDTVETVAAGQAQLGGALLDLVRQTVTQVENYLDVVASGAAPPDELLFELLESYEGVRAPTGSSSAALPAPSDDSAAPRVRRDNIPAELREVFMLEAEEHLRHMAVQLPMLERQPENKDLLQDIRRSVHTLKGSASMVGFQRITQLAHRMEDLLDLLYEGRLSLSREVLDLLLASTDTLEDMVRGDLEEGRIPTLYARFVTLLGPTAAASVSGAPSRQMERRTRERRRTPDALEPVAHLGEPTVEDAAEGGRPARHTPTVRVPIDRLDELVKLFSELVISRTIFEQRMADLVREVEELRASSARLRRVSSRLEAGYEVPALGGRRPPPAAANGANEGPTTYPTHEFDDLEFDRYTEFHLLTRELAETNSDIHAVQGDLGNLVGEFDGFLNRQTRLSRELQDKLMRVRMVPLATLANRLQRAVRVVAGQQSKLVDLVFDGENTELDKTVLEEMADPLMHLLRNAVDHGIEPRAVRRVSNKPERGLIRLRAYHEGTQIVLQVSDDGVGLYSEVLRSAAVHGGFLSGEEAQRAAEDDLRQLVFLPGFSTVREVSEVSGRGVGLDIVRAHVQRLKGMLTLDSTPGRGTTFTIRLPTNLAIARALLVRAHQQTFAIPLGDVRQVLRLERAELERIGREPVLQVEERVYPLLYLGRVLNLGHPPDDTVRRPPVVIVNAGDRQVALVVDHLLGGREIVVKSLGGHLRRVKGVQGGTLMGDGSVVLILNTADLLHEGRLAEAKAEAALPLVGRPPKQALSVFIVDDSASVRRVVTNLVQAAGWVPLAARDGLEALEMLQQADRPPDVILLDIEMPRMDGYELLATLKSQKTTRNIPVVMLTSRAGEKHRRKALDLGAAEYVVKPYSDEVLLGIIRRLAREPRAAASTL